MQLDNESYVCLAGLIIITFCAFAFDFALGCVTIGLYILTYILLYTHLYLRTRGLM
jgi:hypothetical protein